MKKKFIKIWAIGSLTLSLGAAVYAYGCAGDWWGSSYNSLFSPEITVNNKDYEPFFYDDYTTFYNGYSINSTTELFKEETVTDWTNYLKKYSPETVSYFLYETEINATLEKVAKAKDVEAEFKKQKFKHQLDLSDEKSQKFVLFILIARGIETYSNQTYDYWDYDNRKQLNAPDTYVSKVENLYKKDLTKNDSFFKNRIWFQVLRTKFYSGNADAVIQFFNETSASEPKNSLYYRGLSYVAGSYKKLKNYQKSNTLFAEVFNNSKPLMPSALFDFKPLDATSYKAALDKISNKENKEAFMALHGYYTNSFDVMKDLYQLNPASKHLDFLLSRWVNINEQSFNIYTGYNTLDVDAKKVKKEFKNKLDQNQLKWINQVTQDNKISNPFIWKVATAYFNSLNGDYSKAASILQSTNSVAKNNQQKNQVRSLVLFNNLLSVDKMNKAAEDKLLADMNWLLNDDQIKGLNPYEDPNRMTYLAEFSKKYISSLYKNEGDLLMSELTYSINGFYKDQKQSVAMEKLLLNKTMPAWQKVFVATYPFKLADIYESRGIYLFYQDKIDEAIVEFEKIEPFESKEYNWEKDSYETKMIDYKTAPLPGNPFNGKIKDCNDCDHLAKQSVKFSSLDFLKKVKEMKAKIKAGEDVYNNALLIGNAFYNASYFGNARAFYYNTIVGEYGNSIGEQHASMLYGMDNVVKYYKLAQSATQDKEQLAKMSYLLAKVERNNFYTTTYFNQKDGYWGYHDGPDFKAWQGFKDLKTQYSDTKYYKDVIAECGYFRKYLGLQ